MANTPANLSRANKSLNPTTFSLAARSRQLETQQFSPTCSKHSSLIVKIKVIINTLALPVANTLAYLSETKTILNPPGFLAINTLAHLPGADTIDLTILQTL